MRRCTARCRRASAGGRPMQRRVLKHLAIIASGATKRYKGKMPGALARSNRRPHVPAPRMLPKAALGFFALVVDALLLAGMGLTILRIAIRSLEPPLQAGVGHSVWCVGEEIQRSPQSKRGGSASCMLSAFSLADPLLHAIIFGLLCAPLWLNPAPSRNVPHPTRG